MSERNNPNEERLMIVHFVEPVETNMRFEKWPLHISVLPWFYHDQAIASAELDLAVEHMRACRIALGAKALGDVELFGPNENIPVRRVNNSTSLGVIHGMLLAQFHQDLMDKTFIGGAYNPHLTIRENEDPGEDSEIDVCSITLVRRDDDIFKTVIKNFDLRAA